jgi:hypothetical protein
MNDCAKLMELLLSYGTKVVNYYLVMEPRGSKLLLGYGTKRQQIITWLWNQDGELLLGCRAKVVKDLLRVLIYS